MREAVGLAPCRDFSGANERIFFYMGMDQYLLIPFLGE